MIKLNPLWVGLLGFSLGLSPSASAEVPTRTIPMISLPTVLGGINLSRLGSAPLLSQIMPIPAKPSPGSAEQSFTQLLERYRCVTAPGARQTFQGQSTNRYAMAALLAACLESLGDRPLSPQEESTFATLRSEFRLELAALQGGQADALRLGQPLESASGPQQPAVTKLQWSKVSGQDLLSSHQDQGNQPLLGIKAEATFGKVGLFGRYSIATNSSALSNGVDGMTRDLGISSPENRGLQTWSAGIGIRGFIIPKSVLSLSAGRTLVNALGQPNTVNYGAFYQFPLGDSVTLSPSVVIISNPNNPGNPDIQGAVQASFSF